MDAQTELGQFLRVRRSQLHPHDLGLSTMDEPRRVPGLRRSEVAMLAGVSESYYRNLEQGVSVNASPQVLNALARVLRLDPQEHEHLMLLARGKAERAMARVPPQERITAEAQRFMELINAPVMLTGRTGDVLGWNPLAHALFAGHMDFHLTESEVGRPNLARLIVTDPHGRELFVNWHEKVRDAAAHLRLSAGSDPDDPQLTSLVGELCLKSPQFANAWTQHEVRTCGLAPFSLRHPLVGELTVEQHTTVFPVQPDLTFMIFSAAEGSASQSALALLSSLIGNNEPRRIPPGAQHVDAVQAHDELTLESES